MPFEEAILLYTMDLKFSVTEILLLWSCWRDQKTLDPKPML
jgi:hypothetical protein